MRDIAQNSSVSVNTSKPLKPHEQGFLNNLFGSWNALLRAIFLEFSAIFLAGYLTLRLSESWSALTSISNQLWIAGAIAGGILGLYVVAVLDRPSLLQR